MDELRTADDETADDETIADDDTAAEVVDEVVAEQDEPFWTENWVESGTLLVSCFKG